MIRHLFFRYNAFRFAGGLRLESGAKAAPDRRLITGILLACCLAGTAQARQEPIPKSDAQATPGHPASRAPSPGMSGTGFCSNLATVSEKALLKNFLCDQKKIWTAPFRSGTYQWRIVLPLAGGTAALIATDKLSGRELTEGPPGAVFNASRRISYMGSAAGVLGFAGAFYGISRLTHNRRMRETALLSAEALADVAVLSAVMKAVSQRQRPSGSDGLYRINDARGEFWAGGNSFPSLHAGSVWALAAVFASRYRDKPVIKFGAYGLAAMISVSRMTARQHFPSDVLVGSVIGYFIGRYVARANRH